MHILILKNRGILGWLISANAIGFKTHALLLGHLSGPVGALRQRLRNVASILSVPVLSLSLVPLSYAERLALQACHRLPSKGASKVSTSQSYETYRILCQEQKTRALTQRRFCDMIGFLDLYGLINARIVSLGRYGKTREIMSSLPDRVVKGLV